MSKLVKCKSCGSEIARKAKICPNCGAKNKKPFYLKWWFWLFIVIVFCGIVPSENSETQQVDQVDQVEQEEKSESIVLISGEAGAYGEMFTTNKGTEFEETYYIYHVPAGTYLVTNTGEYTSQFNVCSNEIVLTEEGWEEPAEILKPLLLDVGSSETISIPSGFYVDIKEPSNFTLEKTGD